MVLICEVIRMIKKIKQYFALQRRIQIEILETLSSICLYLNYDGHYSHNRYAEYMISHSCELQKISKELRDKER